MTKSSQTQSSICDSNELSGKKTGGEVEQPRFPPLSRGEEDAERVSWTKVREFVRCSYRTADNINNPLASGIGQIGPTDS